MFLYFEDNAGVIVNNKGEMKGTERNPALGERGGRRGVEGGYCQWEGCALLGERTQILLGFRRAWSG